MKTIYLLDQPDMVEEIKLLADNNEFNVKSKEAMDCTLYKDVQNTVYLNLSYLPQPSYVLNAIAKIAATSETLKTIRLGGDNEIYSLTINDIPEIIEPLSESSSLSELEIVSCKAIGMFSDPHHLTKLIINNLPNLISVNLSECQLRGHTERIFDGLMQLPRLQKLDLSWNRANAESKASMNNKVAIYNSKVDAHNEGLLFGTYYLMSEGILIKDVAMDILGNHYEHKVTYFNIYD